jgi:hypothetical protein
MPLWLLAPLVVFGITLVVWLVKRSGGIAAMLDAFRSHHPEARILDWRISPGGEAAFMRLSNGALGVAVPFGRHFVTRVYGRAGFPDVRQDGASVHVAFHEAGFPPIIMQFADPSGAASFIAENLTKKA